MKVPPPPKLQEKIWEKYGLRVKYPWPRWLKYAVLIGPILFLGILYFYTFIYTSDLQYDNGDKIDFSKINSSSIKRASYVYDYKGVMTGRFFEEIRDTVRLNDIPPLLQQGFIAAEDQRFYRHFGIDPIAVTRAGFGNVLRWFGFKYFKRSGASSITQQFARLILAEEVDEFRNRDQTWTRKAREARIAVQLEKHYPKDLILEDLINLIYFGHGVNGVAEASQRYFGKNIRTDKLTLREIVILVSLNKSPVSFCPVQHSETEKEIIRLAEAKERYNWVLGRMLDEGYINQSEYEQALFKKDESVDLGYHLYPIKKPTYGYGNRVVKEMLLTSGYDDDELSQQGLRVYTTIDTDIQEIISEEFTKHLTLLNQDQTNPVNGAFLAMDINGNILAMSGGNNFNESQYNRVFAPRSPGSAAKLFTFAAALEYHGKDLFSQVNNRRFTRIGGNGRIWAPNNFEEKNPVPYGPIDFSRAWYRSVNLATLNLAMEIGMNDVLKAANQMGVYGNTGIVQDPAGNIWFRRPGYKVGDGLEPTLPTAIGASEVNLIEMANAFITFFREGQYITPTLIKEVEDYKRELKFKAEPRINKQFSKETSDKIVGMMRAVTKIGTAKISMRNIEQEVACKTGTSDGPRDVSIWCGTPELFIAFRFGHDNYEPISVPAYMKLKSGDASQSVSGGWVAGPLMRQVIDKIYKNREKKQFSEDVEYQLKRILDKNND